MTFFSMSSNEMVNLFSDEKSCFEPKKNFDICVVLIWIKFLMHNQEINAIFTTHHTWTPRSNFDDEQPHVKYFGSKSDLEPLQSPF